MTYKLKIHLILKNFFLKLDKIHLLPNFVKKISKIIYEVSNNYTFDRDFNGENKIIIKLKDKYNLVNIFDVGANKGYWSKYCYNYFPKSNFYLFEITPSRIKILKKIKNTKFNIYNFGLSNQKKISYFYDYNSLDGENSFFNTRPEIFHKKRKCRFVEGNSFCKKKNIKNIDFLKIDVEGMEHEVMLGFDKMIKKKKIKIIQFEYTIANSISKIMLKDIFDLFDKHDYLIGKLTVRGVKFFKIFKNEMNNFYSGPNYIACPKNQKNLIKYLSNF